MAADPPGPVARVAALDLARTLALLGMAAYHFTYDLALMGLVAPGTATTGGWAIFARLVAGSFLFLAGVSLWLAHGRGLRARAFLRRLAVVAAAALAVTAATRIALPERFVYFGILHAITAASVIGLAFLRLPVWVTVAAAAAVVLAGRVPPTGLFDHPVFWPLGLTARHASAIDYVPLVPWLAPCLLGLALARLADHAGLWDRLRGAVAETRLVRMLSWPGRHSLAVYLVHQPVLLSLVWLAARFLP